MMVQRFTLDMESSWTKFIDENGEYVTYADYKQLKKENEELKAKVFEAYKWNYAGELKCLRHDFNKWLKGGE